METGADWAKNYSLVKFVIRHAFLFQRIWGWGFGRSLNNHNHNRHV